jgi:hypothetical protein
MNFQYNPLLLQENTLRRIKKALDLSKSKIKDKKLTKSLKKILTDPDHQGLPLIGKDKSIILRSPSKQNEVLHDYIRRIKRASKNATARKDFDAKHGFGKYNFSPFTKTGYYSIDELKSKTIPREIKSKTSKLNFNINNNPRMLRLKVDSMKPNEWI